MDSWHVQGPVDNPDGSFYYLEGPFSNGEFRKTEYPSGTPKGVPGQKPTSITSATQDGKVVANDGGKQAVNAGTDFGNKASSLQTIPDSVGLGNVAGPKDASQGSAGNANPAFQGQTNFTTGQTLLGYADKDRAAADDVTGNQNKLLSSYSDTIHNPNAPSVAASMLAANNDQNMRSQLGSAAGVGGANAFAARRQALNNIATGSIGTAGQAAVARAKEVADAQNSSNTLLGSMSANDTSRINNDTGNSEKFAHLASDEAQKLEEERIAKEKAESAQKQTFFNRLMNAASMGTAGGLGSAPSQSSNGDQDNKKKLYDSSTTPESSY